MFIVLSRYCWSRLAKGQIELYVLAAAVDVYVFPLMQQWLAALCFAAAVFNSSVSLACQPNKASPSLWSQNNK